MHHVKWMIFPVLIALWIGKQFLEAWMHPERYAHPEMGRILYSLLMILMGLDLWFCWHIT